MIKKGEIVEEHEHGKRLYRSVASYPQDPSTSIYGSLVLGGSMPSFSQVFNISWAVF